MPTLASRPLPDHVQQPGYDRRRLVSRIVHIGFGAFHRAHQGAMTDRVLNRHGGDWGICEVSLHSADLLAALRRQDHLYTVVSKGPKGERARVIGAVCDSLVVAEQGIDALLAKLAEPQVAIVSLTITEKGYCIEPGSGQLDLTPPGIMADLAAPHAPATVPGILVEALNLRYQRGLAPFTVLSCDNIPGNGHVVRASVLGLAQARDAALGRWIADNASFPATMVDRIVPAASEEMLAEVAAILGVRDPCAIACEPFIQWVIEDNFVAGRPQWELAGAQLVNDVAPFEEMKLRMLNGSHSFLAWLGYLAGYAHISDCMNDATLRAAVEKLMLDEQAPTLQTIAGVDTGDYARQLLARFANPALKHRTWQIAMDSTQKLPQRILDPLRWHLRQGSPAPLLTLAVAGWMRYAGGIDERGQPIAIRDPLQDTLAAIAARHEEGPARVRAWLALCNVFGQDLPENPAFVAAVTEAYRSLMQHGALATVAGLVND